jgi:hypothetical protein
VIQQFHAELDLLVERLQDGRIRVEALIDATGGDLPTDVAEDGRSSPGPHRNPDPGEPPPSVPAVGVGPGGPLDLALFSPPTTSSPRVAPEADLAWLPPPTVSASPGLDPRDPGAWPAPGEISRPPVGPTNPLAPLAPPAPAANGVEPAATEPEVPDPSATPSKRRSSWLANLVTIAVAVVVLLIALTLVTL